MHILFISDNFPPEVNAPATRTFEHCKRWKETGVSITVITCHPNFPQGKVYPGHKNTWRKVSDLNGIKTVRVWSYIAPNKGFLRRTLDYISFAVTAWWAALWEKTDVIVATSPQFFAAIGGWFAAFCKRKPWVMEVRDLWPESIKAVEAMENRMLIRWLEKIELFLYRRAKAIIVVTESFKDNLVNRGVPADKIFIIRNGVNMEAFLPQYKDEQLLANLNLSNKFIVGYIGTHGLAHKLDFILDCAKLTDGNIHFLFIGDGAEKETLVDYAKKLNLSNVTFLPFVTKAEISRYIGITDVALVPLKKSDTFKSVIPSKIFENAAMQKPILLGVEGESKALIEFYNAGLCFEPENQDSFLAQLNTLQLNPDVYKLCQEGCASLATDFDRNRLADEALLVLENIIKPKIK